MSKGKGNDGNSDVSQTKPIIQDQAIKGSGLADDILKWWHKGSR